MSPLTSLTILAGVVLGGAAWWAVMVLTTPSALSGALGLPAQGTPVEHGRPPSRPQSGAGGHYIEEIPIRPSEWGWCDRPGCSRAYDDWAWTHSGHPDGRYCSLDCAWSMPPRT